MPRRRGRSQRDVVARCEELRASLERALDELPSDDPAVIDAVWHGEALGTLLWSLQLAELPAYDTPFTAETLRDADLGAAAQRPADDVEAELATARLWHWRARTSELAAAAPDLPPRFSSLDQVVAATAMRGYERGVLPAPLRGDFRAYGRIYRHLTPEEQAEAYSVAVERHHALAWLLGDQPWDEVPLDT